MGGKGRCIDIIFIELLWLSLKYKFIYMHAREAGSQGNTGIGRWIYFYNHQRPHTAYGGRVAEMIYWCERHPSQPDQRELRYIKMCLKLYTDRVIAKSGPVHCERK
jgi:putative transposase